MCRWEKLFSSFTYLNFSLFPSPRINILKQVSMNTQKTIYSFYLDRFFIKFLNTFCNSSTFKNVVIFRQNPFVCGSFFKMVYNMSIVFLIIWDTISEENKALLNTMTI